MREKADRHSNDETGKRNSEKIEPEPPEKLDKEHGEEVQPTTREGNVATGDK